MAKKQNDRKVVPKHRTVPGKQEVPVKPHRRSDDGANKGVEIPPKRPTKKG